MLRQMMHERRCGIAVMWAVTNRALLYQITDDTARVIRRIAGRRFPGTNVYTNLVVKAWSMAAVADESLKVSGAAVCEVRWTGKAG